MAKAKKAEGAGELDQETYEADRQGVVNKLVGTFGKDTKPSEITEGVVTLLKDAGVKFSESTINQYVNVARKALGFPIQDRGQGGGAARKTGGTRRNTGAPTLDDMKAVRAFAGRFGGLVGLATILAAVADFMDESEEVAACFAPEEEAAEEQEPEVETMSDPRAK